ncbi:MAG: DNA topoisomerase IV, partial [Propionibacteriaceae bacterium]|nr:DNA topoisomerase IV [Propionibacteriaceae bacterium]
MEYLLLSATGRLARATLAEPYPAARAAQSAQPRAAHDVIRAGVPTDTPVAAVTSAGRAVLVTPADLPEINPGAWSLADAPAAAAVLGLAADETVVTLAAADPDGPPLALGTVQGVVKRVVPEYKGWAEWEVIALKDGDRVVGAGPAADADE